MVDYLYISKSYTVYGRSSQIDYGFREEDGHQVGRAFCLNEAIRVAEQIRANNYFSTLDPDIGLKISESAWERDYQEWKNAKLSTKT